MIREFFRPVITTSGLVLLCVSMRTGSAAERLAAGTVDASTRIPWTASRVFGSPEPASPYRTVPAFPNLKFEQPTALVSAPDGRRWFLTELTGKIFSFPNDPHCKPSDVDLFLDLPKHVRETQHIYGLAFPPDFNRKPFIYVCYLAGKGFSGDCRVSRFQVQGENPPKCDPASEQLLLKWPTGGHNGGCLEFGPDGFLYISTGDGAAPSPPDPMNTGQDISDLLSSILRIDVNRRGQGLSYAIPPDNPFVDRRDARPEIWAYGLRNPWKMTFDARTGDLWVGDVGWELWEMVFRIKGGDNCGWSAVEGGQSIRHDVKPGPTPIQPPIIVHPRSEARSVTGGYVYRGKGIPELEGVYVYGDYVTGKIWGLRYDGKQVSSKQELLDSPFQIISFAEDRNRELYVVDYGGTIHRLVTNTVSQANRDFPRRLSETGLFTNLSELRPAPGVVPYAIPAEPWADGARILRHMAVPTTDRITILQEDRPHLGERKGDWSFPEGTVFSRTLFLELAPGGIRSSPRIQPIETQLLHWEQKTWRGYTYIWNDEGNDAVLAPIEGAERLCHIVDRDAPAEQRQQTWQFTSRNDCLVCHSAQAGPLLGYTIGQLSHDQRAPGETASQFDRLLQLELIPHGLDVSRKPLVDPYDSRAPLQERARSYLDVNCAHCHGAGGGATSQIRLQHSLPLDDTGLLNGPLTQGDFGIQGARVVVPGDPFQSVLYYRMAKLGPGRMPRTGSRVIDRAGLALIRDWVLSLSQPPAKDASAQAGDRQHREITRSAERATADPIRTDVVDSLLSTPVGGLALANAICENRVPAKVRDELVRRAMETSSPPIRDLFEPFLPEEKRRKSAEIVPANVLAIPGDSQKGEKLYFGDLRLQCRNCHQIGERGKALGPNLREIGRKYGKPELLASILKPSEKIDLQYIPFLLTTKSGKVHAGLIVERGNDVVVLRDSQGELYRVPEKEVAELASQSVSIMPEGALRGLTPQEAADLLTFLASLK